MFSFLLSLSVFAFSFYPQSAQAEDHSQSQVSIRSRAAVSDTILYPKDGDSMDRLDSGHLYLTQDLVYDDPSKTSIRLGKGPGRHNKQSLRCDIVAKVTSTALLFQKGTWIHLGTCDKYRCEIVSPPELSEISCRATELLLLARGGASITSIRDVTINDWKMLFEVSGKAVLYPPRIPLKIVSP